MPDELNVALDTWVYQTFRRKHLETLGFFRERREKDAELLDLFREKGAPAKLISDLESDISKGNQRITEAERELAAYDAEFQREHAASAGE